MKTIADLSILIVEDEPLQRSFIIEKLRELGVNNIQDASDGMEAIALLKERPVDLIFCDIGMPNMDGSQFILALTTLSPRARDLPMLIWLSAHDGDLLESHLQMARSAGFPFSDAIAKPLSSLVLGATIDAALALLNAMTIAQQTTSRPGRSFTEDGISDDDVLRAICDTSEFEVWYQPHISLSTKMIVGADALVRWSHPKFSGLSPSQFMDLIERQGLGLMLFYRTVNHVLKTLQKLERLGCSIPVCVKASATTLETPEIADYLYERIQRHEISPSLLTVGISDNEPPQEALKLAASLNRLRLRGLGLSIDDFGSGISTMKLLSQMPFTEIRIDGHFVRQFLRQAQCRVIVESIINIARSLKLKVTAEGIENARQMEVLAAMGCMYGQGAIIKPMKQEDFLNSVGAAQLFNNGLVDA
ncbi:EAL domain-containing response regulator [Herbaspirillum rhizosphaerae]|uniref:EAL domain-containing response regulator n=1 Tax=Herbaspirillum rhizosphaerae TaxID=346179 RepID=UPI00067CAB4E|nr:EAL domain-containing protein [Herbaspirillum rhizosphaerae]